MSYGILYNFKPVLSQINNKTAVCFKIFISFYYVTIFINIYICNKYFFKFSSPRDIILICPKLYILKHINKEKDNSLVVVEYIPFLSNLSSNI